MKRLLAVSLTWFAAAVGVADGIPARLPYEPPPPAPATIDLRGTTWSGNNDGIKGARWTVVFEPDGTFNNSYFNNTYRNGTWKQEGSTLYIQINNKYAEFQGVIHGDTIQGQFGNVKGVRWQILLNRMPPAK